MDTNPKMGDTDNNLLAKICQTLSDQNGGVHPPRFGDTDNNLLYKIAALQNLAVTPVTEIFAAGFNLVSNGGAVSGVSPIFSALVEVGVIEINGSPFTSLNFPLLTDAAGLLIDNNASLTSVSFPLLEIVLGDLKIRTNPALTSLSIPSLVFQNAALHPFTGNAFSQVTVDHILARAVSSAGFVTGSLNLSGGTSAAPSVAGAANKAILQGRGVTVTTN